MLNIKECDNPLVAVLACALRAKMLLGSNWSLENAEEGVLELVRHIVSSVERRLWPQVLHATLRGLALRTADTKVAGRIASTLWALDPDQTMPRDHIQRLCLGRHHDRLREVLEHPTLMQKLDLS